jgi:hypothetical protein
VPHDDELTMLREEAEALAEFLRVLRREFARLEADFAAILEAVGDRIEVPPTARRATPRSPRIERTVDPATGAITFRLMPKER